MADQKKADEFVVRMPDIEKAGFRPRSAAASPRPGASRPALDVVPESVSRLTNNAPLSVLAYCLSSISMTVVNKYVVSGRFWNLTFFYLTVQAVVCICTITACKQIGLIRDLAPFDSNRAKKCTTRIGAREICGGPGHC